MIPMLLLEALKPVRDILRSLRPERPQLPSRVAPTFRRGLTRRALSILLLGALMTPQVIGLSLSAAPAAPRGFRHFMTPMMASLDISGTFKDNYNQSMILFQNGTTITGDWAYYSTAFSFSGILNGYVLTGTLTNKANPASTYPVSVTFAPDAKSFTGTNGYVGTWSGTLQPGLVVRVSPSAPQIVKPGDVIQFSAQVAGSADKAVTWTATAGSVDGTGRYVVPVGVDYSTQTITATAQADGITAATSKVSITPTGILEISGTYKDNYNQSMILFQNGTTITGDWAYYSTAFSFSGTLNGYVLTGTLTNKANATSTYPVNVTFAPAAKSFTGTNGYVSTWSGTFQPGVVIRISPAAPQIRKPGDLAQFTAQVAGSPNKGVSWSATAGVVDATGIYTVPAGVDYTAQTIIATAQADGTTAATSKVSITPTGVLEISGTYKDNYNQSMILFQNGTTITGDWTYSSTAFSFSGTLNGYVLTGTLTNKANTASTYPVNVTIAPDAKSFTGTNGYVSTWSGTFQPGVVIRISPAAPQIRKPGDLAQFTAQVAGSPDKAVIWSATAGVVDATGKYTVPNGYDDTTQTITASSTADTSKSASSQVSITSDGVLKVAGVYLDSRNKAFTLAQTGNALIGDWVGQGGTSARLTLDINGYEAVGTWSSDTNEGPSSSGNLKLTFAPDRKTFQGLWGYDAAAPTNAFSGTLQLGKVGVVVRPRPLDIRQDSQQQFQATVVGHPNPEVYWAILEPLGGSITITGLYTSPGALGSYTLKVLPKADASQSFTVPIRVNAPIMVTPGTTSVAPLGSQVFKAKLTGFANNQSGVTWSVVEAGGGTIDASGKYTAPETAGVYTVKATSLEDPTKNGTATITVPFRITVAPSSVDLIPGQTQRFVASLTGHPNKDVEWILPDLGSGSIAADGTYTAPSNLVLSPTSGYQSFRVVARSKGDPSKAAAATAYVYKPLYLNNENLVLSPGASFTFYVNGVAVDNLGATWSTSGGTLAPYYSNGPRYQQYTAPATSGAYTVTATSIKDPSKQAVARIWVGSAAPVSVSPTQVSLRAETTYRFYAYLNGQPSSAVTWSASGGSIASDGTFTAPALAGTYTVTATSVADPTKAATAIITVPIEVVVTPSGATLKGGTSQAYSAAVFGTPNKEVAWRLYYPEHGTLSQTGVFTSNLTLPQSTGGWVYADAKVDPTRSGYAYYSVNQPVYVSPTSPTVALGGTQLFNATLTGLTGTVIWTASGGSIAAVAGSPLQANWTAPLLAGQYLITATSTADPNQKATALAVVPVKFSIKPERSLMDLGFSQQFLAILEGQTNQNVVWSVVEPGGGTISAQGVYTTPDRVGTFHVNGVPEAAPLNGAQATIQVVGSVLVDPGFAKVKPGGSASFRAIVPGAQSQTVAWSVNEANGGTITTAGVYTAPATNGTYHVSAVSTVDPTFKGLATIIVDGGAVSRVTVTPGSAETNRLGNVQFSARVEGNANQEVAWSASAGSISASGLFTAPDALGPVTITASSAADPSVSDTAVVEVKAISGTDKAFAYDENGNMASDGERTFEWDAENRLVAVTITATGHRTEFGYDGLGRRVEIIEKDPDATQTLQITSSKKYLWDGVEIAEERDSTGANVTKRFYAQGFVDSDGTVLFYTRDHLGSIRELTDSSQTVRARYEYDPYGRVTKVSGDRDSLFLYTGHLWHAQSGLNLALYRAYDPNLGRWISRDPIGEVDHINLYTYVQNSPIKLFDILGLKAYSCKRPLSNKNPGDNSRNGPDIPGNPLYHQYYCIERGGVVTCHGQAPSGSVFGSPGRPTTSTDGDILDPRRCKEIPSNECFERCLEEKGRSPRPPYGVPFGKDCQEWHDDVIKDCKKQCGLK